jgi:hypothetical protein
MKFLCIECDRQMTFEERELPGDWHARGVVRDAPPAAAGAECSPTRSETQLVSSLWRCHRRPYRARAAARDGFASSVATGQGNAFSEAKGPEAPELVLRWSPDAVERLARGAELRDVAW